MKPLDLNLASRPFTNDTPLVVGLVVLAILALGLTAYDVHAWMTADTRKAVLESQIADHRVRMREMKEEATRLQQELDGIDLEVLSAQADFVADVLRQRNFSWTRLFNDLEDVLPWNVRLVSIRPSFEAGQILVALDGVARHKRALFDFEEILERSPRFSRVTPQGFRRAEGSNNVLFTLEVRYTPAPPSPPGEGSVGEATGERAATGPAGERTEPAEVIEVEGEETEAEAETADAETPAPARGEGAAAAADTGGKDAGKAAGRTPAGGGRAAATGGGGRTPSRGARRGRETEPRPADATGAAAGVAGFVPAGRATRAGSAGRGAAAGSRTRARVAPDRAGKAGGAGSTAAGAAPRRRKTPEPADPEDVVVIEDGTPKIKLKPVPGTDGWGTPPSSGNDQGEGDAGNGNTGDGEGGTE